MEHKLLSEHWSAAKGIFRERAKRTEPEYPTGIKFLDELTDGITKGEIWVIAGKSSGGKTSLALQMAMSFAENKDHTVVFLSLEMKGWELATRLFCSEHNIPYIDLRTGIFPDGFEEKDKKFQEKLTYLDFEIFEFGYNFVEVEQILKQHYNKKLPDVIFVDFLQLIEWVSFKDERLAIMEYMRRFKELAKRLNVAIVIISQLRRLPSGADYQREPDMIDLKGSGAIETTADKVILIYKKETKLMSLGQETITTQHFINLAKNRQGETKCVEVRFIGQFYRFEEYYEKPSTYPDNY